ncbi:MAG: glycosyltransferase family 4 protein [Victivallales bacterium]|nr:glycosyltransferase family 4 protein [Victivallales bacterium]
MKIAFDFNTVVKNKYSGFYTFGINLLKAFDAMDEDLEFRLFLHRKYMHEAEAVLKDMNPERFKLCPARMRINHLKKLWKNFNFPRLEHYTGKFDLYHSFHNMMPPNRGKARVLTVHDLRRYRLPGFYNKAPEIFERAVRTADHIITVSDATRKDTCEIFNVDENKVTTVHLSCDPHLRPLTAAEKDSARVRIFSAAGSQEPGAYLLSISADDHRKNIGRTIEAFKLAKPQIGSMKLIVAGFLPKNGEELARIQAAAEQDKDIILAGPVEDLNLLIACSEGLLFNSLYEGFGIPILEAFACGVPVLTSDCSSMPEVGGDAAVYADPYDVAAIAEGIVRLFSAERETLIERGGLRRRDFSWEKAAKETLEVYKQMI